MGINRPDDSADGAQDSRSFTAEFDPIPGSGGLIMTYRVETKFGPMQGTMMVSENLPLCACRFLALGEADRLTEQREKDLATAEPS